MKRLLFNCRVTRLVKSTSQEGTAPLMEFPLSFSSASAVRLRMEEGNVPVIWLSKAWNRVRLERYPSWEGMVEVRVFELRSRTVREVSELNGVGMIYDSRLSLRYKVIKLLDRRASDDGMAPCSLFSLRSRVDREVKVPMHVGMV